MKRIAVFSSHNGSNLQAIIDGCKRGKISAVVALVVSNNPDSFSLERAKRAGIPRVCLNSKALGKSLGDKMLFWLAKHDIDIVFLAGYLKKLPQKVLREYEGKVFNIHPSLLPKFGGKGMYGTRVHRAVLQAGETETGVTIHRVNSEYDTGETVAQFKVPVESGDTAETLAKRVLAAEHKLLVQTLHELAKEEST